MNELAIPRNNFIDIHNKAYRLAAAVFMIAGVMDQDEELRTKIKQLSLNLVSLSVNLKDRNISDVKKIILDLEKNSLELMSMLDIASVAGLISKMNGDIIKSEFQAFVAELENFASGFEENRSVSVKNIFTEPAVAEAASPEKGIAPPAPAVYGRPNPAKPASGNGSKNGNGLRRKDLRKNMIFEFVKGHNNVSIKDIVPNVTGCSEKTVQRELIALIKEGKIKKTGERRWSKYSAV